MGNRRMPLEFPAPDSSQMQSFGIGKFINIDLAVRAIVSQVRHTAVLRFAQHPPMSVR